MKSIDNLSDITIGDFIKISQTNGPTVDRFHLAGKVIKLNPDTQRLEIQTTDGIIGVGWEMDGIDMEVSKLAQRPKGWAAYKKNPHPVEKVEVKKTSKELVFDLVKENPRKRLPGLLKLAKTEIGGSDAILTAHIRLALMKLKRLNPVK